MHPQDGRVVSSFVVQALQNEPIPDFGEGRQTRSFCYVDDLIDGLTGLTNVEGDIDGPMNLGNPAGANFGALLSRPQDAERLLWRARN